ncbi:MAG: single-stranded DNA-binding protein [Eubacteriales bacterium]|nr:single-stranded DNA-binding protein [Eubacteriales bacterium]
MNKVILMGRLTRDPDMRYTQGENSMAVARYTLAVDRRRSNADGQREADFISCVAFGRQAEFAGRYLHQGTKIAATGRIQTGSYTNKDGQKVYTTDVVIEEQEFAESKNASENRGGGYQQNSGYQVGSGFQSQPAAASSDVGKGFDAEGFMNIPEGVEDEGLPFN